MFDPRIGVCAVGESNLQDALHNGLGHQWVKLASWAWDPAGSPHPFLFGAVTLAPTVDPALLADVTGPICDSFAQFTAGNLRCRTAEQGPPWMFRGPGPVSNLCTAASAVIIRQVCEDAEVLAWERVVFLANGSEPAIPGELHPAGSQRYPGLTLFLAEADGQLVGAGLGLEGPGSVTVSAMAVLPSHRRCGIGTELTAAALRLAPNKPATLSTSKLGRSAYYRLGFREVGVATHWE